MIHRKPVSSNNQVLAEMLLSKEKTCSFQIKKRPAKIFKVYADLELIGTCELFDIGHT